MAIRSGLRHVPSVRFAQNAISRHLRGMSDRNAVGARAER